MPSKKKNKFNSLFSGKNCPDIKDPELETLLGQYTCPRVHPAIRKAHIAQLSADILHMDYLPPQSFTGQTLTQLSFISAWTWFFQAGTLSLIFLYAVRAEIIQLETLLSYMAPGLALILTCEISKSFRAKMWEMEASCRYHLPQIFFMRLCILFGGDFLVLSGALIAYRMTGGPLWEFCYHALLPFFLTSAMSLYALRRAGNRCNPTMMAAVPLLSGLLIFLILPPVNEGLALIGIPSSEGIPLITALAFVPLLYNSLKLCTRVHYMNDNRKDCNTWNFE